MQGRGHRECVDQMTGRERVRRALTFQSPGRVPRDLWWLPGVEMFRRAELDALLDRFPSDFTSPEFEYGEAERASGTPYVVGKYAGVGTSLISYLSSLRSA
jgi:hypothetical protein